MTTKQEKISAWLAERSVSLHNAYTVALDLLADSSVPGRAQLICHAGRNLCAGLQDIRGVAKRGRADTTAIFREIEPVWERAGLDVVGVGAEAPIESATEQSANANIQISNHLLNLFQRLMQEYRKATENQQGQADELFGFDDPDIQKRPETLAPLRRQWVTLRHWFHGYAHFGADQTTPDEKELRARFSFLEDCILSVIQTFYEGMEGLDEYLGRSQLLN